MQKVQGQCSAVPNPCSFYRIAPHAGGLSSGIVEGGLLTTPWTSPNRSRTMPRAQAMNSLRDVLRDEMIDKSARPEGGAARVQPVLAGISVILSDRTRIRNLSSVAAMMTGTAFAAMVIGVMISRFTVNNS